MRPIDLRSDTVTQPGEAMRQAMALAEVGDDVFGEDPSVRRLEERAADLVAVEAALFVPSGTMANQIALRLLARPGEVVAASWGAHVACSEGGAAAGLSGLHVECVGRDGFVDAETLRALSPPDDPHYARLAAVALENTHNASGGRVWPRAMLQETCAAARELGLSLHLDGARLFNAAVARGGPAEARRIAEPFDTVGFCLSKGLGAPAGSMLCGSRDRIREARRIRKMFGGGMRQAGVLAAAGLFALDHHVDRLAEDHAHARRLAAGLRNLGLDVPADPETNIVMFRAPEPTDLVRRARAAGVLVLPFDRDRLRAVTHLDVGAGDIDEALARLGRVLN